MFSSEFCEILQSNLFIKHLWEIASEYFGKQDDPKIQNIFQQTFTFSKLAIETLETGVEYVQS